MSKGDVFDIVVFKNDCSVKVVNTYTQKKRSIDWGWVHDYVWECFPRYHDFCIVRRSDKKIFRAPLDISLKRFVEREYNPV